MKKLLILLMTALMIFSFTACGGEETPAVNTDPSFDEANILTAELTERVDNGEEIEVTFVAENIGNNTADDSTFDFACYDADGNELYKYYTYLEYALAPGETAVLHFTIYLDGTTAEEVASIELVSYDYYIGTYYYQLDLKAGTMDSWDWGSDDIVDFDEANIIDFEITNEGLDEWGDYIAEFHIINNSDVQVTNVSLSLAFLDANGQYLDFSNCYTDSVIDPGKFLADDTFSWYEAAADRIKSVVVYDYSYDLVKPDANGYNHYDIDIQTEIVYGSLYE